MNSISHFYQTYSKASSYFTNRSINQKASPLQSPPLLKFSGITSDKLDLSKSKMHPRFATVADIPTIQKIAYAAWPIAYKDILSPEQIAYDLQRSYSTDTLRKQMEKEHHQFFLLGNEDSPIGFAAVSPWNEDAQHLFLQKIYLMPELKGQGNGKSLMDSVDEYGKDQGYK